MSLDDLIDEPELKRILRLDAPKKRMSWFRVRPFFAIARVVVPNGTKRGHVMYDKKKVAELMEGRREVKSGLSQSRALKRVG